MGKNADKKNLLDIFFHQNHGLLVLLSFIPFSVICFYFVRSCLSTPIYPYPTFSSIAIQYTFNTTVIIAAIALFYYFRYGGSFNHAKKPEWDEIPIIVKEDIFLAKATIDDLVALELVWKHPPHDLLNHTDEEALPRIEAIIPREDWQEKTNPWSFFRASRWGHASLHQNIFFICWRRAMSKRLWTRPIPISISPTAEKRSVKIPTPSISPISYPPVSCHSRPW